jgi:hypothetical protein
VAMDIQTNLAEALILRMEHEKLVGRKEDAQGFDVLFSGNLRCDAHIEMRYGCQIHTTPLLFRLQSAARSQGDSER